MFTAFFEIYGETSVIVCLLMSLLYTNLLDHNVFVIILQIAFERESAASRRIVDAVAASVLLWLHFGASRHSRKALQKY